MCVCVCVCFGVAIGVYRLSPLICFNTCHILIALYYLWDFVNSRPRLAESCSHTRDRFRQHEPWWIFSRLLREKRTLRRDVGLLGEGMPAAGTVQWGWLVREQRMSRTDKAELSDGFPCFVHTETTLIIFMASRYMDNAFGGVLLSAYCRRLSRAAAREAADIWLWII